MKINILFMSVLLLMVVGCSRQTDTSRNAPLLAKINNYELKVDEFEQAYKDSPYSINDTLDARKDFLNILINRKIILQDAERKNLDKDQDFLAMVERFWEQSLLKIAIDKKSREIASSVTVNDKEVEEAYKKISHEDKTDKPYDQMYNHLKWEISQSKESQVMDQWITQLHNKAKITVNYDLLNKQK